MAEVTLPEDVRNAAVLAFARVVAPGSHSQRCPCWTRKADAADCGCWVLNNPAYVASGVAAAEVAYAAVVNAHIHGGENTQACVVAEGVAAQNAALVLEVAQLRRELENVRVVMATEVKMLDRLLGPAPTRPVAASGFVESPDLGPTINESDADG